MVSKCSRLSTRCAISSSTPQMCISERCITSRITLSSNPHRGWLRTHDLNGRSSKMPGVLMSKNFPLWLPSWLLRCVLWNGRNARSMQYNSVRILSHIQCMRWLLRLLIKSCSLHCNAWTQESAATHARLSVSKLPNISNQSGKWSLCKNCNTPDLSRPRPCSSAKSTSTRMSMQSRTDTSQLRSRSSWIKKKITKTVQKDKKQDSSSLPHPSRCMHKAFHCIERLFLHWKCKLTRWSKARKRLRLRKT